MLGGIASRALYYGVPPKHHFQASCYVLLGGGVAGLCAVGYRLMPGSGVERRLKWEVISKCYNGLVRGLFGVLLPSAWPSGYGS